MQFVTVIADSFRVLGIVAIVLVSFVGIRLFSYYHSFFFHWPRYRQMDPITTADLRALTIPFIKIQITTRGGPGSSPVIQRGIEFVLDLVNTDPDFYGRFMSIEVVTESLDQKTNFESEFRHAPIPIQVFVMPQTYQTPNGTLLKARGLHYMVEQRRAGMNRRPNQTFIVHYDEESVMLPTELQKLIHYVATSGKLLTEGPIYYPLEYRDASLICRIMEANRPVGCFECRHVMESGTPLHMHGSNMVIDEDLENELGWDIGNLDGQPFIAEDYVFGVMAYLRRGPEIFGWHGCVMLEQPPFSFASAFKQRYRWIIGVYQGIEKMRVLPQFRQLPSRFRTQLSRGTLFRITTFALGFPTGLVSIIYTVIQLGLLLTNRTFLPLPTPVLLWLSVIGFLWLNSVFIGAWYNVTSSELGDTQRWIEIAKSITYAPIAGTMECAAAFWAMIQWGRGNRQVNWQPTPKTSYADKKIRSKA